MQTHAKQLIWCFFRLIAERLWNFNRTPSSNICMPKIWMSRSIYMHISTDWAERPGRLRNPVYNLRKEKTTKQHHHDAVNSQKLKSNKWSANKVNRIDWFGWLILLSARQRCPFTSTLTRNACENIDRRHANRTRGDDARCTCKKSGSDPSVCVVNRIPNKFQA